jgi:hypothetical protein
MVPLGSFCRAGHSAIASGAVQSAVVTADGSIRFPRFRYREALVDGNHDRQTFKNIRFQMIANTPSFRHPIQFGYVRAKARFISAALIKGKVTSLKENRADNVRREVAWNQERNVGFGWGNAVRAVT